MGGCSNAPPCDGAGLLCRFGLEGLDLDVEPCEASVVFGLAVEAVGFRDCDYLYLVACFVLEDFTVELPLDYLDRLCELLLGDGCVGFTHDTVASLGGELAACGVGAEGDSERCAGGGEVYNDVCGGHGDNLSVGGKRSVASRKFISLPRYIYIVTPFYAAMQARML